MKFRRENPGDSGAQARLTSSEEMREMAEALSLYRSAMQHIAEKHAERPFVATERRTTGLRMRLVLVPALGAALAAVVIGPAYVHLHNKTTLAGTPVKAPVQTAAATTTVASVSEDDTALMNQIDSDLAEDVPDALQPLTGWDDTSTSAKKSTGTEK
jgi:hypothetical protein